MRTLLLPLVMLLATGASALAAKSPITKADLDALSRRAPGSVVNGHRDGYTLTSVATTGGKGAVIATREWTAGRGKGVKFKRTVVATPDLPIVSSLSATGNTTGTGTTITDDGRGKVTKAHRVPLTPAELDAAAARTGHPRASLTGFRHTTSVDGVVADPKGHVALYVDGMSTLGLALKRGPAAGWALTKKPVFPGKVARVPLAASGALLVLGARPLSQVGF